MQKLSSIRSSSITDLIYRIVDFSLQTVADFIPYIKDYSNVHFISYAGQ